MKIGIPAFAISLRNHLLLQVTPPLKNRGLKQGIEAARRWHKAAIHSEESGVP